MSGIKTHLRYTNPYDVHKALINQYILKKPGDTKFLGRDTSKDKTDFDVLRENHKFLWNDDTADTWEAQFAKKYYDKLFKEYCIGDLSRYKENKVALRWRTEQEVVLGKGQFICANKKCTEEDDLKTWEINFCYQEEGQKKNALVKIRLCPNCSAKINYHSKKREIKRLRRQRSPSESTVQSKTSKEPTSLNKQADNDIGDIHDEKPSAQLPVSSTDQWKNLNKPIETKSREEEMEEYLQDMLF